MRGLIAVVIAIMLAGCALGIQPGKEYPSETFMAPITYQEAYRRADAQPRQCFAPLTTSGNLFTDNKTGVIHVTASIPPYGGESMNVHIAQEKDEAKITVTVWGHGWFDQRQIDAMRETVMTGVVVCPQNRSSINK